MIYYIILVHERNIELWSSCGGCRRLPAVTTWHAAKWTLTSLYEWYFVCNKMTLVVADVMIWEGACLLLLPSRHHQSLSSARQIMGDVGGIVCHLKGKIPPLSFTLIFQHLSALVGCYTHPDVTTTNISDVQTVEDPSMHMSKLISFTMLQLGQLNISITYIKFHFVY